MRLASEERGRLWRCGGSGACSGAQGLAAVAWLTAVVTEGHDGFRLGARHDVVWEPV